jgi:hypothetical protein
VEEMKCAEEHESLAVLRQDLFLHYRGDAGIAVELKPIAIVFDLTLLSPAKYQAFQSS